jgi:hypothetical protein
MFAVMAVLLSNKVIELYCAPTLPQNVNNVALQDEEALYVLR